MNSHRKYISPSLQKYKQLSEQRRSSRKRQSRGLWRWLPVLLALAAIVLVTLPPNEGLVALFKPPDVIDEALLQESVEKATQKYAGVFGIYLHVLESGEKLVINDEEYSAASCYKLPLALMCFQMAASGEIDLESKVAYAREDWEAGTGVLQATKPGAEFSMRRLLNLSIIESDNIAANMLLRRLGKSTLADFHRTSGAKVIPVDKNVSTPGDMGMFAEGVVRFAQKNPELGLELLEYLRESRFKDRLAAPLPDTVIVGNKIGTVPGAVNDVAIIIADNVTYVLAVLSRDVASPEEGGKALSDISLAVWKHISERAKMKNAGVGKRLLSRMK